MTMQLFATPATTEAVTMTSLEIVAFINAHRKEECEANETYSYANLGHNDFLKKVPEVLGKDAGKFSHIYFDSMNRKQPAYKFPKREACLMAMSYSYAIQAAVYDHMTKLEDALQGKAATSVATLPTQAAPQFEALFKLATLIGCDNNAAAISANQGIIATTGLDLLGIMGLKALPSPEQAIYCTPTELGKQCTPTMSAVKINQTLAVAGLQQNTSGHWEATEAGKPYSRTLDTGKKHNSGAPVQQVKWLAKVLDVIRAGE